MTRKLASNCARSIHVNFRTSSCTSRALETSAATLKFVFIDLRHWTQQCRHLKSSFLKSNTLFPKTKTSSLERLQTSFHFDQTMAKFDPEVITVSQQQTTYGHAIACIECQQFARKKKHLRVQIFDKYWKFLSHCRLSYNNKNLPASKTKPSVQ